MQGTKGYFARKSFAVKFSKCVYLSLFIIIKFNLKSVSLIHFKLNKLMVAIGKKPNLGDNESSLKNLNCKLSLARCPCSMNLIFYKYL